MAQAMFAIKFQIGATGAISTSSALLADTANKVIKKKKRVTQFQFSIPFEDLNPCKLTSIYIYTTAQKNSRCLVWLFQIQNMKLQVSTTFGTLTVSYLIQQVSKFLTIDATELVGGKRLGFVMDITINEFTGLMNWPFEYVPGGAQRWTDVTSGDLHFMIRNDEQNILGMLTIEGWRDAWPKADEILDFDTLRTHPLNNVSFITKDFTFEATVPEHPYMNVSNLPGPTDDYNNEDNYFDLSVQIETLSFDPSTNEPNWVISTATYTGSEFLDAFAGGPNNTTYISVENKDGIWPDSVHYKGTLKPVIVDFETSTVFKEEWQTTDDFSAVASIAVDGE